MSLDFFSFYMAYHPTISFSMEYLQRVSYHKCKQMIVKLHNKKWISFR